MVRALIDIRISHLVKACSDGGFYKSIFISLAYVPGQPIIITSWPVFSF